MACSVRPALVSLCLASALLTTPAFAQMQVDDSFVDYNITWSGIAGGWSAKWRPIDMDGMVGICGVGTSWGHSARSFSKRAMRDTVITVDGRPLSKDLTFFAEAPRRDDLATATANCVQSTVPIASLTEDSEWDFENSKKVYRD